MTFGSLIVSLTVDELFAFEATSDTDAVARSRRDDRSPALAPAIVGIMVARS